MKKTKNKKFFFQQIILIFAVLLRKFLQIVFVYIFLSDAPQKDN